MNSWQWLRKWKRVGPVILDKRNVSGSFLLLFQIRFESSCFLEIVELLGINQEPGLAGSGGFGVTEIVSVKSIRKTICSTDVVTVFGRGIEYVRKCRHA